MLFFSSSESFSVSLFQKYTIVDPRLQLGLSSGIYPVMKIADLGLIGIQGMPSLLRPCLLPLIDSLVLGPIKGDIAEIPVAPEDILRAVGMLMVSLSLSKAINFAMSSAVFLTSASA